MKSPKLLHIYVLFALALSGGCASDDNFINTKAKKQWQLKGKIGLAYPEANCGGEDCRMKSDQGKIQWAQNNQAYSIKLSDPFGRVVMEIEGNNQQLQAQSPNQEPIQATPNEFVAILANNSNNPALSSISPSWLSYWVTGRPAPDIAATEQGNNQFEQAGYVVKTQQWRQTAVGKMPSLINVTKDKFKLRLVIRQWVKFQTNQ